MTVPHTTPDECDRREAMGIHIGECHNVDYPCNGYLGPYDTYVCICWCHRENRHV